MKKTIIAILFLFAFFGATQVHILPIFAEEQTEGALPYYVEPILPENQDKGIDSYVSVSPQKNTLSQSFSFLVSNKTNTKQIIDVNILNAYTSANGGIQYNKKGTEDNNIINQHYKINQYVKAPDKIELEGGESKIVEIQVDIPETDGTILGAVAFQGETETTTTTNKKISFEIKNEINTVYGIAVHFPTEKEISFLFDKPTVYAMPSYYAVRLPITLNSPLIFKNGEIDYEVYFKGKKLFFSKEKVDFAPMTKTKFTIPFDYGEIEKNKPYLLKGVLTYTNENGEKKEEPFEFTFKYDPPEEQVKNTITKMLKKPTEKSDLSSAWLFGAGLLAFFLFVFFYKRSNTYVLDSDLRDTPIIVDKEHSFYSEMKKWKRNDNQNKKYVHFYKKTKTKEIVVYYYIRTKENKIK